MKVPLALTIAGSDSGGCAGIQADLKTFGALGVHGMSAVTAVTAQNTREVLAIHTVPPEVLRSQIEAILVDLPPDAIKTGMLPDRDTIELVAASLQDQAVPLVVDPVLVSTAGDRLAARSVVGAYREYLFSQATVVTPNLPELAELSGIAPDSPEAIREGAEALLADGARAILVKGGHGPSAQTCIDYLIWPAQMILFEAPRIDTRNTHGSGCTLAAAIAAYLAQGRQLSDAVQQAKTYVTAALSASLPIGHGAGPLGHFWQSWKSLTERPEEEPDQPE